MVSGPFRHRTYRILWSASFVANTGSWMYAAASAWLMTSLDSDPLLVSLVQVAASLPMFLFALPAGAAADIVDKRPFLIAVDIAMLVATSAFAVFVWRGWVTPTILLIFVFLIETGTALEAPAWQAIVPLLVPKADLPSAVAANSAGINLSRAFGPALGGVLTVGAGIAVPFVANAASALATLAALVWWRPPREGPRRLPAERFVAALRAGIRYARNNPPLRATLARAIVFFLFASAYWAVLPLLAREQLRGGPETYGLLLGAIGAGAVGGAFALGWIRARLGGADLVVDAGSLLTAVALVLYGLAREPWLGYLASALAGLAWIAVLSNLNVSAQFALPEWVRARGLAIYVTVFFGAMTAGSAVWGEVASRLGLPMTHFLAAAFALLTLPFARRWRLQASAALDLSPSMHWPAPVVSASVERDQGPVLVTIEYRVAARHRAAFLHALAPLGRERKRDGAYAWGVFEDLARPDVYLETFMLESWLEHLRQHERVTNADRVLQERVHSLLDGAPVITHLVDAGARRDGR
jgi:MFS family permease